MTNIIIRPEKSKNPEGNKLEGVLIAILTKAGVPSGEVLECLDWAFGPNALYVPIYPDWIDRWHKLHPKSFHIHRKEKFLEMMYVIGFHYCVEKKRREIGLQPKG